MIHNHNDTYQLVRVLKKVSTTKYAKNKDFYVIIFKNLTNGKYIETYTGSKYDNFVRNEWDAVVENFEVLRDYAFSFKPDIIDQNGNSKPWSTVWKTSPQGQQELIDADAMPQVLGELPKEEKKDEKISDVLDPLFDNLFELTELKRVNE